MYSCNPLDDEKNIENPDFIEKCKQGRHMYITHKFQPALKLFNNCVDQVENNTDIQKQLLNNNDNILSRLVFYDREFKIIGPCGRDAITELRLNKIKIYDVAYDFIKYGKMVHRVKNGIFKNYEIVGRGDRVLALMQGRLCEFYTIDLVEPSLWFRLTNLFNWE